jgi:hypothetical protein
MSNKLSVLGLGGRWVYKNIYCDFFEWLNYWGNKNKDNNEITFETKKAYTRGYHQAISDVFNKLEVEYETDDKRTKTGFRK